MFNRLLPDTVETLTVPEYVAEDSEKLAPPHHANGLMLEPVETGNTDESPYVVGVLNASALIPLVYV
jgi:hypothetical protein